MSSRLTRFPITTVIPAKPGVPGRAAGCKETRTLIGYNTKTVYIPPQYVMPTGGGEVEYGTALGVNQPRAGYWLPGRYDTQKVPYYKTSIDYCWPAVAAVPAQPRRIVTELSSWSSGARSRQALTSGKAFTAVTSKSPIAIALAVGGVRHGMSYGNVTRGVIIRDNMAAPLSSGVEGAARRTANGEVVIERNHGEVRFFIGGEPIATYQADETETLYVFALLYSVSDYLDNAAFIPALAGESVSELHIITELEDASAGIAQMKMGTEAAASLDGATLAAGSAQLRMETKAQQPLLGSQVRAVQNIAVDAQCFVVNTGVVVYAADSIAYAAGSMAARGLGAETAGAVNGAQGRWPRYKLDARAGRGETQPISGTGGLGVVGAGNILSGGFVEQSTEQYLAMKGKAAEAEFAGGTIAYKFKPVFIAWEAPDTNEISFYEQIHISPSAGRDNTIMLGFMELLQAGVELELFIVLPLNFNETLIVEDELTFGAMLELLIAEQVLIAGAVVTSAAEQGADWLGEELQQRATQYAVNATTGALSRYADFGFKQFTSGEHGTFAITDDAVYQLGGNTDDGELLSAMVDFGAKDYGSAAQKIISSVYAGIDTDGEVYLQLAADRGAGRIYRPVKHGIESRAMTAKGVRARHWRLQLAVEEAEIADLDNVEVEIGVIQRRL